MKTNGFVCAVSDAITLDSPFQDLQGNPVVSSYIMIPTGGTEGGIVFSDNNGNAAWWPYAFVGYNPIAATKILTSATVKGIPRTTTAVPTAWAGEVHAS